MQSGNGPPTRRACHRNEVGEGHASRHVTRMAFRSLFLWPAGCLTVLRPQPCPFSADTVAVLINGGGC